MHIVIHTQYYPPEIGAPQARLHALVLGLVKRGHQVTVLTAMPNYPQGVIYQGYGGWIKKEEIDGAQIIRSWVLPAKKATFLPRLMNYFSFMFSSFCVGLLHLQSPKIIITESPPLFLGITGFLLGIFKRAKWIFNISDLWPDSALWLGVIEPGFLLKLSYKLEGFLYHQAEFVSGQSREILKNIQSRFPSVKTVFFPNGSDVHLFSPEIRSSYLKDHVGDGLIVLYAGLHGMAQGLDQLLNAVQLIEHTSKFKMVLMGGGPVKDKLIDQARDLENVFFLDPVPRKDMPEIISSANFCVVPLGLELPGAVPSKLYEAMSAGKPVVLMAHGEAAEIVKSNDCGIVVEPGDVQGLAIAIQQLIENEPLRIQFGINARRAALEHYDRMKIVNDFVHFLEFNG